MIQFRSEETNGTTVTTITKNVDTDHIAILLLEFHAFIQQLGYHVEYLEAYDMYGRMATTENLADYSEG